MKPLRSSSACHKLNTAPVDVQPCPESLDSTPTGGSHVPVRQFFRLHPSSATLLMGYQRTLQQPSTWGRPLYNYLPTSQSCVGTIKGTGVIGPAPPYFFRQASARRRAGKSQIKHRHMHSLVPKLDQFTFLNYVNIMYLTRSGPGLQASTSWRENDHHHLKLTDWILDTGYCGRYDDRPRRCHVFA